MEFDKPIRCYGVSSFLLKKEQEAFKVLLLKRADTIKGAWCQVAGKIEPNEKAWQAALREIKEETGLVPEELYSADICEQFYEIDKDSIWIAPVFIGFFSGNPQVIINEEHSEYHWFTVAEAINQISFPGGKRIIRHINEEFIENQPVSWLRININH